MIGLVQPDVAWAKGLETLRRCEGLRCGKHNDSHSLALAIVRICHRLAGVRIDQANHVWNGRVNLAIAPTDMNHMQESEESYPQDILKSVKTIAMVGASPDRTKFSYGVLRVLHETGYDVAPINPRPEVTEIRGIPVYDSLAEVDRPIDMVQVFRRSEDLPLDRALQTLLEAQTAPGDLTGRG